MTIGMWIVVAILALALRRRIVWLLGFVVGLLAGVVASIFFAIVPLKLIRS